MPTQLDIDEIEFGLPEFNLYGIPEEIFFKDREEGILRPNTVPLPDGVKNWVRARYQGEDIHAARVGKQLYMLADTTVFGYALFHFVSDSENDTSFRVAFPRSQRIINSERSVINMASLAQVSQQFQSQRPGGVRPMNLSGGMGGVDTGMPVGEGISSGVDVNILRNEAMASGYVAGYIMANAPQVTMSLYRSKDADGQAHVDIRARESKPSRMLSVLMALPARCVTRNGGLATPTDIASGAVDFNTVPAKEMMYLEVPASQAISFIFELGQRLPEYAPNVSNRNTHWSREDILTGKPEVTYVYVKPIERRGKAASTHGRFNFVLKSTAGRKSLFTQKNHMCLRALEHVSTKCTTEADVYEVNRNAFGAWEFRHRNGEAESTLQRAMRECPSQIWSAKYNVDGKEVQGIGSAFFMTGSTVTTESGEEISAHPLMYMPWFATGDQRQTMGTQVTSIVKRTYHAAEGNRKEGMSTTPILWREDPNNKMFKTYTPFINMITSQNTPFVTMDQLRAMGTRASTKKANKFEMTDDQKTALRYYMDSDAVKADLERVRNEVARRAALRSV